MNSGPPEKPAKTIAAPSCPKSELQRRHSKEVRCSGNKSMASLWPARPSRSKRAHSRGSSMQRTSNKRKKPSESTAEKPLKKRNRRSKRQRTSKRAEHILSASKPAEEPEKSEYQKRLACLAKFGKNFYCASVKPRSGLRPIYIDGSNVAFSHGQNERFSVQGLQICIDYFRKRGHEVKAFVPHFRLRKGKTTDQKLLHQLVTKKLVIITPTLYIQNQRRSPYDDWYIIQSAAANGGIVVSSDSFADIVKWNPNLRPIVEEQRLVPTFVDDMIIFPVDPHGNRKNNLEQMLKF
ncbi:probable ribonuclease ZC3H12B isoform X1 [Dendroctonus ponderosae]|uniref:RNase NYN domain-containing protein n=1 Tax=Dendroctonus ponderosae TaxID=77166 RepID=U4U6B3_DENPD|nr:probable ribonuclease ZC3H12B isoform X1 [Dendroctonus ponderosae]ERL88622.1 hypothetical protein D910_06007 [Dendroctonus ponderosae]